VQISSSLRRPNRSTNSPANGASTAIAYPGAVTAAGTRIAASGACRKWSMIAPTTGNIAMIANTGRNPATIIVKPCGFNVRDR
jgi:hypothetical protein